MMDMKVDTGITLGNVIAKAWTDEDFKQALMRDPRAAIEAEGVCLPEGLEVRVLENSDSVFNLVLPPMPAMVRDKSDMPDRNSNSCWCSCPPNATWSYT
jgi:hypothetical protein